MPLMLWMVLSLAAEIPCPVGDRPFCGREQFCAAAFDLKTASCPTTGVCQAFPDAPPVALTLPVPAGVSVLCVHGPLERGGDTHSTCSEDRRFALDLASLAFDSPNVVLASTDGMAWAWGDCASTDLNHAPPDRTCNRALGNVVQVQHDHGLFTQYAHLSAIFVSPGERVKQGQAIGIEGNSGAAGVKHIHFSLHRGDASRLDPAPSLPIRRLMGVDGTTIDTVTLHCGQRGEGPGNMAVLKSSTQRVPSEPRIGFRPPARLGIEYAVGRLFDAETRAEGIAILRAAPREVLSQYWLAVGLELNNQPEEAAAMFSALTKSEMGPAWVRRWSWLRLADMEAQAGHPAKGRAALAAAYAVDAPRDTDFLRFADWVRRELDHAEESPACRKGRSKRLQ